MGRANSKWLGKTRDMRVYEKDTELYEKQTELCEKESELTSTGKVLYKPV